MVRFINEEPKGISNTQVLRGNEAWLELFQIKLKHIEDVINRSQRVFISILALLGAIFVSIIGISGYIIESSGIKLLLIILADYIIIAIFVIICNYLRF